MSADATGGGVAASPSPERMGVERMGAERAGIERTQAGPTQAERLSSERDAYERRRSSGDRTAAGMLSGAVSVHRLERAVEGVPLILFGTDAEARYAWVANVHPPWSETMLLGRTDVEMLGEEAGRPITEAKLRVVRTGRAERLEIDLRFDRQRHWYEVTLRPDAETGGLVCCALDISEKKRREIMLQALLREVSHRSKNLLSMVLSIAQQTSRKAFDKQTFLTRFTGRIQSIARSQDSITGSDWRGASLSELVGNQVEALLQGRRGAVRREGPDLQLTPNAALHVGLALHELTTNALSHGVLADARGGVLIRVLPPGETTADAPDEGTGGPHGGAEAAMATLEWHELHGAPAGDSDHESFGMTTLKRIVPAAVSGKATLAFTPDGLRYRLTLDPSQFDLIASTGPEG